MASAEALVNGCSYQDVIQVWIEKKTQARVDVMKKLFEKYGPDPSEELGLK